VAVQTTVRRWSKDCIVQVLFRTLLFSDLSAAEVANIADSVVPVECTPGQVVFVTGDEPRGIYVVVSGSIRAVRHTAEGREQVLSVEYPCATLAEVPVFDRGKCVATAIAQEHSELLFITKDDIHRLCGASPVLMGNIIEALARRIRSYADLIHTLALRDVDRRVAWFLLQEGVNRGVATDQGIAVELLATHHDIAARVGCVREMVTRAFGHLHKAGLVVSSGRLIVIPSETELLKYIGS